MLMIMCRGFEGFVLRVFVLSYQCPPISSRALYHHRDKREKDFLFFPLRREDLMGFNRGVNQNLLLLPSPPRLDCGRKIDVESGRPE
jgi:hypothetical protein